MFANDPFPAFEFLKLGQLGEMFGMTATGVGTRLKQVGLRLPNGEPSEKAKQSGVAKLVEIEGMHPFWSWEKARTVKVLEAAGCRRTPATSGPATLPPTASPSPASPGMMGPVEARPQADSDGDGFEIVDANGVVGVWARGERLSRRLAEIMTLAERFGKL